MLSQERQVEFYRGWMIEVLDEPDGFRTLCYSTSRKRLKGRSVFDDSHAAIVAAKKRINRYTACSQLSFICREFCDLGILTLEEWRSLNHSLFHALET